MVLPEPAPPTRSVVRPRGKPPSVISSRPAMPLGALVRLFTTGNRSASYASYGCVAQWRAFAMVGLVYILLSGRRVSRHCHDVRVRKLAATQFTWDAG